MCLLGNSKHSQAENWNFDDTISLSSFFLFFLLSLPQLIFLSSLSFLSFHCLSVSILFTLLSLFPRAPSCLGCSPLRVPRVFIADHPIISLTAISLAHLFFCEHWPLSSKGGVSICLRTGSSLLFSWDTRSRLGTHTGSWEILANTLLRILALRGHFWLTEKKEIWRKWSRNNVIKRHWNIGLHKVDRKFCLHVCVCMCVHGFCVWYMSVCMYYVVCMCVYVF